MADIKIDAGKATRWIKTVREEIESVDKTLDDMKKVCKTFPGEGDTVFLLIEKTGGMLEDTWNMATNAYKDAWEKVEAGIGAVVRAGNQVIQNFDDFIPNIK